MAETALSIPTTLHPLYSESYLDWIKWRLAYKGGRRFINEYLTQFSARETNDDFQNRVKISYSPSFAKAAVTEVKNSIFQRMAEVVRVGGTKTYQDAVKGGRYGVDLKGASMTEFMGRQILEELLVMSKVGIYVDMPKFPGTTLKDTFSVKPYLYYYAAEDILNWTTDESDNPIEYSTLLLRETKHVFDPTTHLPVDEMTVYKHFWVEDGQVFIQFYNEASETLNFEFDKEENVEPLALNITKIPFVVLQLSTSLMSDIADYQVALLNLESADLSYILKANFPFYTEQYDPRADSPHLKTGSADNQSNNDVNVGPTQGRRYPPQMERPGFIHPSSEPLKASMAKEEQIKKDIRSLIHLAITNLEPKMASAESKSADNTGLEAGLSYIGLELQHAERQIGQIWSMYESSNQYPDVNYPEKYNLKTEEDNRKDSTELKEMMPIIASPTYQREIGKKIAQKLLINDVSKDIMTKIIKEIEEAPVVYVPPDILVKDVENGLVSTQTASTVRGYPDGEVEKAKIDHAERLARISIAQSKGAGNPDNLPVPGDGNPNKNQKDGTPNQRGEGK